MATLINGNLNNPVYASQDADLLAAICGNKTVVTPVGSQFAEELEDANTIKVDDGVIITKEGRRIQLDNGDIDEFLIPTGTQGQTQYYICGYHLYTDEESAELCETFVEAVSSGTDVIDEDTFRDGSTEVYVSLLRVKQEGVNITAITRLLPSGTDMNQINVGLSDEISNRIAAINTRVSKSGDTISGNLSISGNLTVQNINAFLHNKVSGTNVAWKDCPFTTDGWYYYEGANVTTYDLPFTHCIIQVYKTNSVRGVAIAYRWDNGRPMTWINNLHDTWRGWKSIGSNYITLKAAATYSSPTVVTLAETMLNYSKLAFNLLEGDQVVDYVEVPVRRFQAGNYFVLHSKQTANSYALIVRRPENMNNEVNIAAISGSPKIEIQGIY